ncbi:MAG: RNA polymerase sigma-70 factor [Bacteroidales bacterium]
MSFDNDHINPELLIRLRNGDILAFDELYKLYSHKLFSFVFRILKDEADADDIVQEVFLKIWEYREKLGDHKLLNSLIFSIAYNNSISLIRKRISSTKYIEYLRSLAVNHTQCNFITDIELIELNNRVENLIASLPERQKQVFLLHRKKGLTYPEISEKLEISKNTVENHMVKALKFLRRNLNSFWGSILFFSIFI